jgi:hypothetical protein
MALLFNCFGTLCNYVPVVPLLPLLKCPQDVLHLYSKEQIQGLFDMHKTVGPTLVWDMRICQPYKEAVGRLWLVVRDCTLFAMSHHMHSCIHIAAVLNLSFNNWTLFQHALFLGLLITLAYKEEQLPFLLKLWKDGLYKELKFQHQLGLEPLHLPYHSAPTKWPQICANYLSQVHVVVTDQPVTCSLDPCLRLLDPHGPSLAP